MDAKSCPDRPLANKPDELADRDRSRHPKKARSAKYSIRANNTAPTSASLDINYEKTSKMARQPRSTDKKALYSVPVETPVDVDHLPTDHLTPTSDSMTNSDGRRNLVTGEATSSFLDGFKNKHRSGRSVKIPIDPKDGARTTETEFLPEKNIRPVEVGTNRIASSEQSSTSNCSYDSSNSEATIPRDEETMGICMLLLQLQGGIRDNRSQDASHHLPGSRSESSSSQTPKNILARGESSKASALSRTSSEKFSLHKKGPSELPDLPVRSDRGPNRPSENSSECNRESKNSSLFFKSALNSPIDRGLDEAKCDSFFSHDSISGLSDISDEPLSCTDDEGASLGGTSDPKLMEANASNTFHLNRSLGSRLNENSLQSVGFEELESPESPTGSDRGPTLYSICTSRADDVRVGQNFNECEAISSETDSNSSENAANKHMHTRESIVASGLSPLSPETSSEYEPEVPRKSVIVLCSGNNDSTISSKLREKEKNAQPATKQRKMLQTKDQLETVRVLEPLGLTCNNDSSNEKKNSNISLEAITSQKDSNVSVTGCPGDVNTCPSLNTNTMSIADGDVKRPSHRLTMEVTLESVTSKVDDASKSKSQAKLTPSSKYDGEMADSMQNEHVNAITCDTSLALNEKVSPTGSTLLVSPGNCISTNNLKAPCRVQDNFGPSNLIMKGDLNTTLLLESKNQSMPAIIHPVNDANSSILSSNDSSIALVVDEETSPEASKHADCSVLKENVVKKVEHVALESCGSKESKTATTGVLFKENRSNVPGYSTQNDDLNIHERSRRLKLVLSRLKKGKGLACPLCEDSSTITDRRTTHIVHFLLCHLSKNDVKETVFELLGLSDSKIYNENWKNGMERVNPPPRNIPPCDQLANAFSTYSNSNPPQSIMVDSSGSSNDATCSSRKRPLNCKTDCSSSICKKFASNETGTGEGSSIENDTLSNVCNSTDFIAKSARANTDGSERVESNRVNQLIESNYAIDESNKSAFSPCSSSNLPPVYLSPRRQSQRLQKVIATNNLDSQTVNSS